MDAKQQQYLRVQAETGISESETIEFKRELIPTVPGAWCEVVKDIVAIINSGGGVLVIGVDDDGHSVGAGTELFERVESAVVCDQILKYTGVHFSGVAVFECARNDSRCLCIALTAADFPLVFCKAGTYENPPGRSRTAFQNGTIYVRHGAKSEPATTFDIRNLIDRRVASLREEWLSNIRKVVEAPPGSHVTIVSTDRSADDQARVHLVDDPTAPAMKIEDAGVARMYPYDYRQLCNVLRKMCPKFLENEEFHSRRKPLEGNPNYCFIRHLDPKNPRSGSKKFYSEAIIAAIIRTYDIKTLP